MIVVYIMYIHTYIHGDYVGDCVVHCRALETEMVDGSYCNILKCYIRMMAVMHLFYGFRVTYVVPYGRSIDWIRRGQFHLEYSAKFWCEKTLVN